MEKRAALAAPRRCVMVRARDWPKSKRVSLLSQSDRKSPVPLGRHFVEICGLGLCSSETDGSEAKSEKASIIYGVRNACRQDVIVDVETPPETFRWNGIRIHGDDVLKAKALSFIGTKL